MPAETLWNKNYICLSLGNLFFWMSFNLLVPILPMYLTEGMGFSKGAAGAVISLFFIAAIVVRPFSGPMADRLPVKKMMVTFLLTSVLFVSGYLFAGTLTLFALLRFGHGFSFGLSSTAMNTLLVSNIPPAKLGTGIGMVGVLGSMSMALAPMVGLLILEHFSYLGVFITSTVLAAVSLALGLPVGEMDRPKRSGEKAAFSWRSLIFRKGGYVAGVTIFILYGYGMVINYVSLLAVERGMETITGTFFTCLAAGVIGSRLFAGWLLDHGHINKVIAGGCCLIIVSLAGYLAASDTLAFLSAGFWLGMGYGCMLPALQTLMLRKAASTEVGTATSTFYLAMDGTVGLAVVSGGWLADLFSLNFIFILSAVFVACGLTLFLLTARELPAASR